MKSSSELILCFLSFISRVDLQTLEWINQTFMLQVVFKLIEFELIKSFFFELWSPFSHPTSQQSVTSKLDLSFNQGLFFHLESESVPPHCEVKWPHSLQTKYPCIFLILAFLISLSIELKPVRESGAKNPKRAIRLNWWHHCSFFLFEFPIGW